MLTAIAFVLAFALGCILAFVRHPVFGLLTYIAEFYLHPSSRWWGESVPDFRWSLIAAAVTAVAIVLRSRRRKPMPLLGRRFLTGYVVFILWCCIQTPWAMDREMHIELITLSTKYFLVMMLIYACIDSETHLRAFLWIHVLGCFYFGWIAHSEYTGGRFEGFGGPGLSEANAAAMQIVTGILVASALFMAGNALERSALLFVIPVIVNGLVTTISRSGFLAMVTGGLTFNLFAPHHRQRQIRVLSVLALLLLLALTGPVFWERMDTISYAGDEVEGVDTGGGRLEIIAAQFDMFVDHPFGCGHRCTATLSSGYLDDKYLTGAGPTRGRSSHNTFMTLLVEQGIPGALFYLGMTIWTLACVKRLRRELLRSSGLSGALVPAIAATLVGIMIGDMFVDYLKLEARMWFIALSMVLLRLSVEERERSTTDMPIVE